MRLMKLLTAGKSFVGGMDNASRYRMGNPGMLPKFGSDRNPFESGAKGRETGRQLTQPPEAGPVPPTPTLSPSHGEREERRPQDETSGVPNRSGANWSSALRSICRGWLEAVKARMSRSGKPTRSDVRRFAKSPVQAGLSLDEVQVVRN